MDFQAKLETNSIWVWDLFRVHASLNAPPQATVAQASKNGSVSSTWTPQQIEI